MKRAPDPARPARASHPHDAHGLAVLLLAAILAAGTVLPQFRPEGPMFPRPGPLEGGEGPPARQAVGAQVGVPGSRPRAGEPGVAADPRLATSLDLNAADAETLGRLPGIGPALAGRIISDRQAHGPFRSPEDLLRVRGIGPKRWERIRQRVRVLTEGP